MILLVDMDVFFASVEQAQHPPLRGKPVIVCGDPSRRGVVTAASYEARPFGVRAGMPLQEARRLCPRAEYVEGNPEKYVGVSVQLLDLYTRRTPDVEPFSVDEAFLGFNACTTLEHGERIARELQQEIDENFALGASIGVGPNKLVAKMAAGFQKPRGITAMDEEKFQEAFWPLPVQEMWGVGLKLATRMRSLGISTVGELARAPDPVLEHAFGIIGPQLREAAWGRDQTPLIPYHQGVDAKSMGHEVTLPEDCDRGDTLEGTLLRLSDQVARRLRTEGYRGRVVAVRLRDSRFHTIIRQRALAGFTHDLNEIFTVARGLFREHWGGRPLRLIGVTVSSLERDPSQVQTELFDTDARRDRLRSAMDRVRDKLGEASLVPAAAIAHVRTLSHVPFGAMSGRGVVRQDAARREKRKAEGA
jgi:DNA polymerase-4